MQRYSYLEYFGIGEIYISTNLQVSLSDSGTVFCTISSAATRRLPPWGAIFVVPSAAIVVIEGFWNFEKIDGYSHIVVINFKTQRIHGTGIIYLHENHKNQPFI